jgi:predicted O-methyltransferase YrrM
MAGLLVLSERSPVYVPDFPRLARITVGAAVAAIAVSGSLLIVDVVSAAVAGILAFDAVVLAGLVLAAGMVRRVDQKVERLTERHDRSHREAARTGATIEGRLTDLDARVARAREWVSRDVFTGYQQMEAVTDLRALIRPRAPMPALRHWALSPDALRFIVGRLYERRPELIVECGSGASSTWLGYFVESLGTGRVVALEHDERFANISRELIKTHGLESVVEIRYTPLTPWRGRQWYDTAAIEDLRDIELLLVDGPPGSGGPEARYPAVPLMLPRCADRALIMLDDAHRAAERAVSDLWLKEYPELGRTEYEFEKHLHVFERVSER